MILIQKAKKSDLNQLKKLRLRSILEEPVMLSYTSFMEEKKQNRLWWKFFFFSKHNYTFTLSNKNKIVGFVRFEKKFGFKAKHKGTIQSIYIIPEERDKGFGKKLLIAIIEYLFSLKLVTKIDIVVCSLNHKMLKIVESLNFKEWGEEPRAIYYMGSYYSDKLFYLAQKEKKNEKNSI
ncbi:MAG: GNAT family N-acetyltransferase [Silvanigrellaceae bacterium]|nr:GNAT family N-acetyltransferase [Silvanigrellaceae bacterium]